MAKRENNSAIEFPAAKLSTPPHGKSPPTPTNITRMPNAMNTHNRENTPTFKHKRVAIDFDGTIFVDSGNIDSSFNQQIDLSPIDGASEVTRWLKSQEFEILIFTCRPDYHRQYLELQLNKNNIYFDYILFYTKPRVDLYIDDKGFRFVNWPETKQWIQQELANIGSLLTISQQPNTDFERILRKQKVKQLHFGEVRSLLDIGCGDGDCLDGITFERATVIDAVEPDANLRALAATRGIYRHIYNDVSNVDPAAYDCVLALGVLEHVKDDQRFLDSLHQAKRIYCTVPNAESFHRQVGIELGLLSHLRELTANDIEVGHLRYYTLADIKRLISGFVHKHPAFKATRLGTTGFKFTSNIEMKQFSSRADHIHKAATKLRLAGENRRFGAEIYFELSRTH